jgi:hypothetical protein
VPPISAKGCHIPHPRKYGSVAAFHDPRLGGKNGFHFWQTENPVNPVKNAKAATLPFCFDLWQAWNGNALILRLVSMTTP